MQKRQLVPDRAAIRSSREWLTPVLVVGTCIILYGQLLRSPFLWDDIAYIVHVPLYQRWENISVLLSPEQFFESTRHLVYRPGAVAWNFLNYQLWGLNPVGWRMSGLAVHASVSVLVGTLARRLFGRPTAGLAAAVLFAAHPIHHEILACASFQSDLVCALLILLAFRLDSSPMPVRGQALASTAFYGAALFFKEMALAYLPLLILYGFLFPAPKKGGGAVRRRWTAQIATTVLYGLVRFVLFRNQRLDAVEHFRGSAWTTMLSLFKLLALHAKMLVFPYPLIVNYVFKPVRNISEPWLLAELLLLASALAAVWRLRRRSPPAAFAVAWIPVSLIPVLNPFLMWNPFAERYLYLPSIGFCWFIGGTLGLWLEDQRRHRRVMASLGTGVLLLASAAVIIPRNRAWSNGIELWTDAILRQPTIGAHTGLAGEYLKRGQLDLAERQYLEALRLASGQAAVPLNNLGLIYHSQGRLDLAERYYRQSSSVDPSYADPRGNLGIVLELQGHLAEAIAEYEAAIRLAPSFHEAYTNLGGAYQKIGRLEEAVAMHEAALRLKPNFTQARANLKLAQAALARIKKTRPSP